MKQKEGEIQYMKFAGTIFPVTNKKIRFPTLHIISYVLFYPIYLIKDSVENK